MDDWCLCVEPDPFNTHIFRASDKAVKVFDTRNPSECIEERHSGRRLISRFKSDGKLRLVSCGLDGHVLVSSLEERKCVKPVSLHSENDYILAVDFDRTRLACGGINGKFSIFTF
jgi:WD40 repeat protein